MEVKNPTITHRAMPAAQQMIARRHTAFDGLRHASVIFQSATRASISSAAILGLRLMSGDPQFDQDKYHEDQAVETRRSKQASSSGGIRLDATQLRAVPSSPSNQTITPNPFDDAPSFRNLDRDDPFDDSKAIAELDQQTAFPYEQEQQYHVFTNKKKWFVVITIGFAGLFSGLSSNIYFPSLDAIAKVSKSTTAVSRGWVLNVV
jgi:hypothetical protein